MSQRHLLSDQALKGSHTQARGTAPGMKESLSTNPEAIH